LSFSSPIATPERIERFKKNRITPTGSIVCNGQDWPG
jgi:hypothetical protein